MYRLTAQDMDQLGSNGAHWGEWAREQEGRFEIMSDNPDEEINYDFKHVHWLEDNWANVILAKMFLVQEGYTYQVLWDLADNTSDYWFARVEEACQTVAGGFNTQSKALRDLTELLRRQNVGYVILTDFSRIR